MVGRHSFHKLGILSLLLKWYVLCGVNGTRIVTGLTQSVTTGGAARLGRVRCSAGFVVLAVLTVAANGLTLGGEFGASVHVRAEHFPVFSLFVGLSLTSAVRHLSPMVCTVDCCCLVCCFAFD